MCFYVPGVCFACSILVRLGAPLARVWTRSLPSILMCLYSQCRVVRLPRWLRTKAESIILVVISGCMACSSVSVAGA